MKKYTKHFILIGIAALALGVGVGYLIKGKITPTEISPAEITQEEIPAPNTEETP